MAAPENGAMTDFSTHVKNTSKGFHCTLFTHELLRARRIRRMCECDRMGWPGGPATRTARLAARRGRTRSTPPAAGDRQSKARARRGKQAG